MQEYYNYLVYGQKLQIVYKGKKYSGGVNGNRSKYFVGGEISVLLNEEFQYLRKEMVLALSDCGTWPESENLEELTYWFNRFLLEIKKRQVDFVPEITYNFITGDILKFAPDCLTINNNKYEGHYLLDIKSAFREIYFKDDKK